MAVVEAWWPSVYRDPERGMCTFYYVIINERVFFVPHEGNGNELTDVANKLKGGFDHSRVTVDALRSGASYSYPTNVPGTLNLDTGEFHAS